MLTPRKHEPFEASDIKSALTLVTLSKAYGVDKNCKTFKMTAPYPSPVQTWHNDAYPAIDPARPELSLHGKRVIVTGGGGTIGLAMVEAFAKAGVALVGIVGRTQKTLDATKSKVEAQFPKVQIVSATANIADAASVDAAFKQIRSHADGPIDILVANAGYLSDLATLWTSEPNEWWKSFEINIKGAFNTIRAFHNVADTRATVINISTAAAQVPSAVPQLSAYSASKRAAVTVFEYLQMENPDWQVVSIQPGIIASDMSRKNAGMPPEDTRKCHIPRCDACRHPSVFDADTDIAHLPQRNCRPHSRYGCAVLRQSSSRINSSGRTGMWRS